MGPRRRPPPRSQKGASANAAETSVSQTDEGEVSLSQLSEATEGGELTIAEEREKVGGKDGNHDDQPNEEQLPEDSQLSEEHQLEDSQEADGGGEPFEGNPADVEEDDDDEGTEGDFQYIEDNFMTVDSGEGDVSGDLNFDNGSTEEGDDLLELVEAEGSEGEGDGVLEGDVELEGDIAEDMEGEGFGEGVFDEGVEEMLYALGDKDYSQQGEETSFSGSAEDLEPDFAIDGQSEQATEDFREDVMPGQEGDAEMEEPMDSVLLERKMEIAVGAKQGAPLKIDITASVEQSKLNPTSKEEAVNATTSLKMHLENVDCAKSTNGNDKKTELADKEDTKGSRSTNGTSAGADDKGDHGMSDTAADKKESTDLKRNERETSAVRSTVNLKPGEIKKLKRGFAYLMSQEDFKNESKVVTFPTNNAYSTVAVPQFFFGPDFNAEFFQYHIRVSGIHFEDLTRPDMASITRLADSVRWRTLYKQSMTRVLDLMVSTGRNNFNKTTMLMELLLFSTLAHDFVHFDITCTHRSTNGTYCEGNKMHRVNVIQEKVSFLERNSYVRKSMTDTGQRKGQSGVKKRTLFLSNLPPQIGKHLIKLIYPHAVDIGIVQVNDQTRSAVVEMRSSNYAYSSMIGFQEIKIDGHDIHVSTVEKSQEAALEEWHQKLAAEAKRKREIRQRRDERKASSKSTSRDSKSEDKKMMEVSERQDEQKDGDKKEEGTETDLKTREKDTRKEETEEERAARKQREKEEKEKREKEEKAKREKREKEEKERREKREKEEKERREKREKEEKEKREKREKEEKEKREKREKEEKEKRERRDREEKERKEKQKAERERREMERKEREKKEKEEREKRRCEREEKEKQEKERREKERQEREKKEQERREKEREKREKERKAREEREKRDREKREKEEKEREEKMRIEQEKEKQRRLEEDRAERDEEDRERERQKKKQEILLEKKKAIENMEREWERKVQQIDDSTRWQPQYQRDRERKQQHEKALLEKKQALARMEKEWEYKVREIDYRPLGQVDRERSRDHDGGSREREGRSREREGRSREREGRSSEREGRSKGRDWRRRDHSESSHRSRSPHASGQRGQKAETHQFVRQQGSSFQDRDIGRAAVQRRGSGAGDREQNVFLQKLQVLSGRLTGLPSEAGILNQDLAMKVAVQTKMLEQERRKELLGYQQTLMLKKQQQLQQQQRLQQQVVALGLGASSVTGTSMLEAAMLKLKQQNLLQQQELEKEKQLEMTDRLQLEVRRQAEELERHLALLQSLDTMPSAAATATLSQLQAIAKGTKDVAERDARPAAAASLSTRTQSELVLGGSDFGKRGRLDDRRGVDPPMARRGLIDRSPSPPRRDTNYHSVLELYEKEYSNLRQTAVSATPERSWPARSLAQQRAHPYARPGDRRSPTKDYQLSHTTPAYDGKERYSSQLTDRFSPQPSDRYSAQFQDYELGRPGERSLPREPPATARSHALDTPVSGRLATQQHVIQDYGHSGSFREAKEDPIPPRGAVGREPVAQKKGILKGSNYQDYSSRDSLGLGFKTQDLTSFTFAEMRRVEDLKRPGIGRGRLAVGVQERLGLGGSFAASVAEIRQREAANRLQLAQQRLLASAQGNKPSPASAAGRGRPPTTHTTPTPATSQYKSPAGGPFTPVAATGTVNSSGARMYKGITSPASSQFKSLGSSQYTPEASNPPAATSQYAPRAGGQYGSTGTGQFSHTPGGRFGVTADSGYDANTGSQYGNTADMQYRATAIGGQYGNAGSRYDTGNQYSNTGGQYGNAGGSQYSRAADNKYTSPGSNQYTPAAGGQYASPPGNRYDGPAGSARNPPVRGPDFRTKQQQSQGQFGLDQLTSRYNTMGGAGSVTGYSKQPY